MSDELTEALRRPDAYPWEVSEVGFLQTHISWLFFAGDRVLKIKKPVRLDFLDYGTLEKRRHSCEEEVRLNRRLAEGVYHGVVPVVRTPEGALRVEADGEPVEWAVKMTRLPDHRMLSRVLEEGCFETDQSRELADLLVGFHAAAATGEGVDEHGSPRAVSRKVLGNLEGLKPFVGRILSSTMLEHLERQDRQFLDGRRELLEGRCRQGRIREGHGDLHAGNICYTDAGIVVYDCIEFSRALRCGDVASDLAFLAMDLDHRGYPSESSELVQSYEELARDAELAELTAFYKRYRAAVRAKVAALASQEAELSQEASEEKRDESRRYLQLAASYALPPAMILTCGLPGTGKSWVARHLARPFRATVLRSDVLRKRAAGIPPDRHRDDRWREGLYSEEMTEKTYGILLDRGSSVVRSGRTVIVDASFPTRRLRKPFLSKATEIGVPLYLIHVTAPESVVRRRLDARDTRREPSDADFEVYLRAREAFEPPEEVEPEHRIDFASGTSTAEDLVDEVIERRLD